MQVLLMTGSLIGDEGDVRPVRQTPHGFDEVEVLVLFDKGENVAAFMAAKTMKNLPLRIDVEARSLFLVEGAQRDEIGAHPFQRQGSADDLNNITGGSDLFEDGRGEQAGHGGRRRESAGYFVSSSKDR